MTDHGPRSAPICVGQFSPVPYPEKANKSAAGSPDTMPAGLIFKLPEYNTHFMQQFYGGSGHFETSSPEVGVALIREFS